MACYHPLSLASHTHIISFRFLASCCIFQIHDEIRYRGLIARYLFIFHVRKWQHPPVGSRLATRWLCVMFWPPVNPRLSFGAAWKAVSAVVTFLSQLLCPLLNTRCGFGTSQPYDAEPGNKFCNAADVAWRCFAVPICSRTCPCQLGFSSYPSATVDI